MVCLVAVSHSPRLADAAVALAIEMVPGGSLLIALAGLAYARELVGPLVLGAVLVIICHPVRHPLERAGWPRWAATTAVIVVAYLIIAILALLLTFAGIQFARLVGDYSDQLKASAQAVVDWVQSFGVDQEGADAAASVLDPSTILSFATSLGGTALGVLTALFFVLAYIIFSAADGSRYTRAEEAFGTGVKPLVRRFVVYNSNFPLSSQLSAISFQPLIHRLQKPRNREPLEP